MDRRVALMILGLPSEASDEAIERAWRDGARGSHPDRFPADPGALVRMTALNLARDALRAQVAPADETQDGIPRPPSSLDALVDGPMPRSARIRGLRPTRSVTTEALVPVAVKRAA